jgi:hypothetical protein
MRNILLISLVVFFIVGCSSKIKRLELKPYTQLSIPSSSINTPSSFPKNRWITYGDTLHDDGNVIQLFRHLPNMMSEDVRITVRVHPKEDIPLVSMLYKDKNDAMEEYYKNYQISEWEKKNNIERGVNYVKRYVDFIGGLKCATRVESSNIALGVGTKSYQTNCNYFDNQKGAKNIHIGYSYTYTHRGTKFKSDKTSSTITPEAMQKQFKQDMKAIFDSLVIHDMDREKMSKEGLLYDKKYDLESEFR